MFPWLNISSWPSVTNKHFLKDLLIRIMVFKASLNQKKIFSHYFDFIDFYEKNSKVSPTKNPSFLIKFLQGSPYLILCTFNEMFSMTDDDQNSWPFLKVLITFLIFFRNSFSGPPDMFVDFSRKCFDFILKHLLTEIRNLSKTFSRAPWP